MVCSTYQHPLYPFSGAPSVPGRIINVELPAETRGHAPARASYENAGFERYPVARYFRKL